MPVVQPRRAAGAGDGAGPGIGLTAAAALAAAGAAVTLVARSAAEIEALAAALRARGDQSEALPLDVTDQAAIKASLAGRPPFDVLANNAGTNRPKPFTEISAADYDAVTGLNVRTAFFVTQTVAHGLDRGGPARVHHRSVLADGSCRRGRAHGALRVQIAIEGLTKAMALDLAPHRIRVNTVCPTFIETPMTRPFLTDPTFRASVLAKIKLGRLGQCEDLMGAFVFLASDASALMTGSAVVIDGGWTAD